ncbi:MAG TPA: formylglycine-generating enzyme family protein [Steroidobacteraceae bacterium]|nr:formylglycine-generating enzyme family protein [Steroidobacteraceae bacterium]
MTLSIELSLAAGANAIVRHDAGNTTPTIRVISAMTVTLYRILSACLILAASDMPIHAADGNARVGVSPNSFRDCADLCPEMIPLPPGRFQMGSPPSDTHQGSDGEERPRHQVEIAYPFAIGRYEITRAEFSAFAQETKLADPGGCNVHVPPRWPTIRGLSWHNTGFAQTDRHPVVCVSWEEARDYTRWLSRKTGHDYRLLSESEWEYSARAGASGQAHWGDRPTDDCRYANGVDKQLAFRFPQLTWDDVIPCDDGFVYTAPVGSFKPNAFGLYDMMGNAFEWVADCWSENYLGAPADGSARSTGNCESRVNRGGSWTSNPTGLRAAHRGNDDARVTRVVDLGFRVARALR